MAFDLIALGTVPSGEVPASGSEIDYVGRAFLQCRRFIDLLHHTVGAEPEGAKLRVRRSGPDFNPYIEVVVEFDDGNDAARAYANRCDREAPKRWTGLRGRLLAPPSSSQERLADQ
jgi:hypothetical protein